MGIVAMWNDLQGAMTQLFAAILSLTALSASILAGLDPVSSLTRGGIALAVGWVAGSIWDASLGRTASKGASSKLNGSDSDGEQEPGEREESSKAAAPGSAELGAERRQEAA